MLLQPQIRCYRYLVRYICIFSIWLTAPLVGAQSQDSWTNLYWDGPNNLRYRYVEQGEGTPIILLHGLGSSAIGNWFNTNIAQKLAQTNRVIALDQRGHGETPRAPEEAEGTMVTDIVAFLDHLGIEKAHIAGYSMGAANTVGLMKFAPERFITASVLGGGIPESEGWVRSISRGTELEHDPRVQDSIDLSTIDFPVLAINGSDDRAEDRRGGFENGLDDLTFVVIPGTNHMTAPRDPSFGDAFASFIANHNPQ